MSRYEYVGGHGQVAVDPFGWAAGFPWEWAGDAADWSGGQTLWRATEDNADLKQLAQRFSEANTTWQCLWPVLIRDEKKSLPAYRTGKAMCDDVYSVENLTAETGAELEIVYVSPGHDDDIMTNYTGFTTQLTEPKQLAEYIRDQASHGASPIRSLIIGSHGLNFWGGATINSGPAGTKFHHSQLDKVAEVTVNGVPNLLRAKEKKGPPRCWFTKNATGKFLGCNTAGFAESMAKSLGRGASRWYGTKGYFGSDGKVGWFQKKPFGGPDTPKVNYANIWNQQGWWDEYKGGIR